MRPQSSVGCRAGFKTVGALGRIYLCELPNAFFPRVGGRGGGGGVAKLHLMGALLVGGGGGGGVGQVYPALS